MRPFRLFVLVLTLAVGFRTACDLARPDVLLVGNPTIDIVDGNRTLGGAVSYAAAVLKSYGKRACVVTAAGPDADLSIFEDHDLHVVTDDATLTFKHSYTWWGHKRILHTLAEPDVTLSHYHVPAWCLLSRVVLLGPLMPDDLDAGAFARITGLVRWFLPQELGMMAQGFQRGTDSRKQVVSLKKPHKKLLDGLGEGVSVFLSDVETDPWTVSALGQVINGSERVLITKGEQGADVYANGEVSHIPVEKVEQVVDTNGAGDTFATAYMLALSSGLSNPGQEAARAASKTVMLPQTCKPWCVADHVGGELPQPQVSIGLWNWNKMKPFLWSMYRMKFNMGLGPSMSSAQTEGTLMNKR